MYKSYKKIGLQILWKSKKKSHLAFFFVIFCVTVWLKGFQFWIFINKCSQVFWDLHFFVPWVFKDLHESEFGKHFLSYPNLSTRISIIPSISYTYFFSCVHQKFSFQLVIKKETVWSLSKISIVRAYISKYANPNLNGVVSYTQSIHSAYYLHTL